MTSPDALSIAAPAGSLEISSSKRQCRHCGNGLGFVARWTGAKFCSHVCETMHGRSQVTAMGDRLAEMDWVSQYVANRSRIARAKAIPADLTSAICPPQANQPQKCETLRWTEAGLARFTNRVMRLGGGASGATFDHTRLAISAWRPGADTAQPQLWQLRRAAPAPLPAISESDITDSEYAAAAR